jgi:hypothetical protein
MDSCNALETVVENAQLVGDPVSSLRRDARLMQLVRSLGDAPCERAVAGCVDLLGRAAPGDLALQPHPERADGADRLRDRDAVGFAVEAGRAQRGEEAESGLAVAVALDLAEDGSVSLQLVRDEAAAARLVP